MLHISSHKSFDEYFFYLALAFLPLYFTFLCVRYVHRAPKGFFPPAYVQQIIYLFVSVVGFHNFGYSTQKFYASILAMYHLFCHQPKPFYGRIWCRIVEGKPQDNLHLYADEVQFVQHIDTSYSDRHFIHQLIPRFKRWFNGQKDSRLLLPKLFQNFH